MPIFVNLLSSLVSSFLASSTYFHYFSFFLLIPPSSFLILVEVVGRRFLFFQFKCILRRLLRCYDFRLLGN